jgi:cell division protein FtsB
MQNEETEQEQSMMNKKQKIILIVGSIIILFTLGLLTGLKIVEKDVNRLRDKVDKQEQELKKIRAGRE